MISFTLAYFLPFQLFLFAYAVLGPFHYLTEIAWLKHHNFFTKSKYDCLFLIIIGLILTMSIFTPAIAKIIPLWILTLSTFGVSLVFFLTPNILLRIGTFFALGSIGFILGNHGFGLMLVTLLIPTIIHVYVFTGLFMIYGALKSKSIFGGINVLLLVALGTLFFILPTIYTITPSQYVTESYLSSFASLHQILSKLFTDTYISTNTIMFSSYGVSIMQFIAFAYTYHYLNWFSKTKVIRWKESADNYKFLIYTIWIGSILLYAYSYSLGLLVLYFLSVTHVLLEFPLNHMTILALLRWRRK